MKDLHKVIKTIRLSEKATLLGEQNNEYVFSVDVDATFCPDPELSILHAFDTLFTAGPCILGSVVNKALGRHGQTQFEPGQVDPIKTSSIPGRTIILNFFQSQTEWTIWLFGPF